MPRRFASPRETLHSVNMPYVQTKLFSQERFSPQIKKSDKKFADYSCDHLVIDAVDLEQEWIHARQTGHSSDSNHFKAIDSSESGFLVGATGDDFGGTLAPRPPGFDFGLALGRPIEFLGRCSKPAFSIKL
jgi:hypothetical protein